MSKKNIALTGISLFIISVFFLSCLYMEVRTGSLYIDITENTSTDYELSKADNNSYLQQQITNIHVKKPFAGKLKQLQRSFPQQKTRHAGSIFSLTGLVATLLINYVLFFKRKGRVLVCFLTYLFQRARFLCELFIQKKKDGKKWIFAF